MIYGSNPLCKKIQAELFLLEVKSRSQESHKDALKCKSILIFSLLSSIPSPHGTCYFEICWVLAWFGAWHKLMGDWVLGLFLFVCFSVGFFLGCLVGGFLVLLLLLFGFFVFGFFLCFVFVFNLTDVPSLGLAEGTDNKIPHISVCSGDEV